MNERRPLTPDEFGRAVAKLLARCPFERQLIEWGEQHASALAAIRDSHPEYHRAARDAYRARLAELKGTSQ